MTIRRMLRMTVDPIPPALVARVWQHALGRSLLPDLNTRPGFVAAVFGCALAEARHIQLVHRTNARLAALRDQTDKGDRE